MTTATPIPLSKCIRRLAALPPKAVSACVHVFSAAIPVLNVSVCFGAVSAICLGAILRAPMPQLRWATFLLLLDVGVIGALSPLALCQLTPAETLCSVHCWHSGAVLAVHLWPRWVRLDNLRLMHSLTLAAALWRCCRC